VLPILLAHCIVFSNIYKNGMPMINPEILELLERFQTALVGAVGFVGVIWTLQMNAKHAKVEHQRQVDTKRMVLRRILAAEFRNYSRALRGNVDAKIPDGELFSVGKIRKLFAEDLNADLGLLELGEVDIVVNALISLDGLEHYLTNLSATTEEGRFLIHRTAWNDFRMVGSTTAEALDLAVQALELSGKA
jgi:hypothetical protein